MRKNWPLKIVKILVIGTLAITVCGFLLMYLWNWLMPALFGWHTITFWQGLGIFVLSKLLFGGFRGGGHRWHWRERMMERWEKMTPEEREKFREGMGRRCGPFGSSEATPKA